MFGKMLRSRFDAGSCDIFGVRLITLSTEVLAQRMLYGVQLGLATYCCIRWHNCLTPQATRMQYFERKILDRFMPMSDIVESVFTDFVTGNIKVSNVVT